MSEEFKTCRTCKVEKHSIEFYYKLHPRRLKSGEWKTYVQTFKDCKKCYNRKAHLNLKLKQFKKVHREHERQKTLEGIQ